MPKGYNANADIQYRTADGFDLNDLWADYQQVLAQWNADRQRLVNFLTFPVTDPVEYIPVVASDGDFQEASEYGVPTSIRPTTAFNAFGYDFKWYDLAARFTWQFLADAPQSRIDAVQNQALEADSRLVYNKVFRRLFNNTNSQATITGNAYNVYTFWNADGNVPPSYKSNVFDGTHNHFLSSGAATVDPGDLQAMLDHLVHHGYDETLGYRIVLMVNRAQGETIRLFRSGTAGATYDFIPAQGSPAFLLPQNVSIIGSPQQIPATLNGFKVIGNYGPIIVIEEDAIPTSYMVMFATGGPDSIQNPIGIRQHANAALRGMRLVKGREPDYPLIDSYYVRGMGTGVRHRGASVVMQVTTNGSYAPPALYA